MKKQLLIYFILIIIVILVWEYFASTDNNVRLFISSPSLIVEYFVQNRADLTEAFFATFLSAFLGLSFAVVLSFSLMFLCFHFPKFLNFIMPPMIVSQVVPVIVLAPFFIIFFGIGITSKIVMAAVISFFPIFINFYQGYKSIPKNIKELFKIYRTPKDFLIDNIYLPLSTPSLIAGLKISSTLAVLGAIVAEFTGSKVGIGKNLFISSIRLQPDLMMTSLILAGLIGFIMYSIVLLVEKRYGYWYK